MLIMSSIPKKEKRRIVPTLISAPQTPPKPRHDSSSYSVGYSPGHPPPNIHNKPKTHDMRPSRYHQDFLDYAGSKDYEKELRERAVKLGYEKERKERKKSSTRKKEKVPEESHGSHREFLNDFNTYVVEFAKMKAHAKGVSLFDYLKKNFKDGKYLSRASKRFRRAK